MTNAGYTEARISQGEGGKITVEIPSVFETDQAASLLGDTAKLTFNDADGNVILDGATDIKNASYQYGKTSQTGSAQSYVQVEFNAEAKQKFADATKAAAARSSEGKNYISIQMDGKDISSPRVSEEINSDSCIISGDFTPETAQDLANKIKSGQLPFDMKVISQETVGAELGANALPTSLLAAAIGIILIMIFMVIMYRIPGLIADISSCVMSEEIDVSKFGLLFAGAQKNLGPAGVTLVIVREDLIGDAMDITPTMLDYKTHADNGSMYNTPPTYGIYVLKLVLEWIKEQGGVKALQEINEKKAKILYDYLDSSKMFKGTVVPEDRSLMNAPFVTGNEELDDITPLKLQRFINVLNE